jgi:hypothetical protein
MCTVSIVPDGDRFTLMSNRDERRGRAVALQPTVATFGARAAIVPIDPVGGGSWLGVNDAGLVAALLNRHAAPQPDARSFCSRGLIVREVLGCDSLDAARHAVLALDAAAFQPFRLVLVQDRRIALVAGDSRELASVDAALDHPYMFTASSLGDRFVDSPRRRLFECLMTNPNRRHQGQRLFHSHQWTDKREISVLMEREDAATVSRTVVDVTARAVALEYESLIPSRPAQRVELQPC